MKKLLTSFFLSLTIFAFLFAPTAMAGTLQDAFKSGDDGNLGVAASKAGYNIEKGDERTLTVISQIINVALSLLGVIFLLLIIYAGYLWMTARGDEQQATKARDIIIRSVTGLIIVLAAYSISIFVVASFTADTLNP